MAILGYEASELCEWRFTLAMIASNASIKAPLEPVKLFQGICEGGCDVSSRFAVQPLGVDLTGSKARAQYQYLRPPTARPV